MRRLPAKMIIAQLCFKEHPYENLGNASFQQNAGSNIIISQRIISHRQAPFHRRNCELGKHYSSKGKKHTKRETSRL
jgi:hypothetical protein